MDQRYVQQFKKGALRMILLCLIGRGKRMVRNHNRAKPQRVYFGICKGGNHLPDFVSFAGSRADSIPAGSGGGQRRFQKVLFPDGEGQERAGGAHLILVRL